MAVGSSRSRRTGHRRLVAVTIALAALTALAGAGSASSSSSTEPTESGGEQPVAGGNINIGIQAETERFYPGNANIHVDARAINHLIYGSLTSANTDGEYVPYLAESVTPNDDATVWTITLRPDLVFHDGTPFDAAALKSAIDAITTTAENAAAFEYVDGTAQIDDLTVEVTLNKPYAVFPQVLADEMGAVPSPTAVESQGMDVYASSLENPPIGAGPYRVVEWVRDSHIVLEKFEDYAFDDRGWADTITFRVLPDDAARAAALEAGDLDVAVTLNPATILSFRDKDGFTVHELDYGSTGILFQVEAVPDLRVRQAVAMAIDKEALIELIWQGVGSAIDTPFPEDSFWHAEGVEYPAYDAEAAAALIEEVEAETGEPVTLTITPRIDETNLNYGTAVVEMLKGVGIDASLEVSVDTNDFVDRYLNGQFQMMGTGMFSVIDPWFEYTRRYESTAPLNGTGFGAVYPEAQAEMDEMLAIGAGSTDPDERKAAYDRAQEILAENLLQLFVRTDIYGVIVSDDILGYGTGTNPDGSGNLGNFFVAIRADELWRGDV